YNISVSLVDVSETMDKYRSLQYDLPFCEDVEREREHLDDRLDEDVHEPEHDRGHGEHTDRGPEPVGPDELHARQQPRREPDGSTDRKSTRLNSSHVKISYAGFSLNKKRG